MMRMIRATLNRFRQSERGSWVVEMALMFPLLTWAGLAMFTYFDAFLAKYQAEKAASSLADMLSRENDVGATYIDYMGAIQSHLSGKRTTESLSVVVFQYDEPSDTYEFVWNEVRNGGIEIDEVALNGALKDRIPLMNDGGYKFAIRTETIYSPIFSVYGLREDVTFDEFVVMRPRHGGALCYITDPDDRSLDLCSPT